MNKYLDDVRAHSRDLLKPGASLDLFISGKNVPIQRRLSYSRGAFIAGMSSENPSLEVPAQLLIIPQIDQALIRDEDDNPIYPETVVILLQRIDSIAADGEGIMRYNVKVGKISSSSIDFAEDGRGGILAGTMTVNDKNGNPIAPMISVSGSLKPNLAFWSKNDVNMKWEDVVYDSFAADANHRCRPISIVVSSLGGIETPISYKEITDMNDKILELLVPTSKVTNGVGMLTKIFHSFKWARAQFTGFKQSPVFGSIPNEKGKMQILEKGQPYPFEGGEWDQFERNVEYQLRIGRRFAVMAQLELLANTQWGYPTAEGELIPPSFVSRHFPQMQVASDLLRGKKDDKGYRSNEMTIVIDYTNLEHVLAAEDAIGLPPVMGEGSYRFTRYANPMARAGFMGTERVAKIIGERRKIAVEWINKNMEAAGKRADQILARNLYDELSRVAEQGLNQLTGGDPILFASKAQISDKQYANWLRQANDMVSWLLATVPGAAAMDRGLIASLIQDFRASLDWLRAHQAQLYVQTDAMGGTGLAVNWLVADQIFNAWREIVRGALQSMLPYSVLGDPAYAEYQALRSWMDTYLALDIESGDDASGKSPSITWARPEYRIQVREQCLAWMAGILDPGDKARSLIEAIMFPELTRIDAKGSFGLLVMQNEEGGWHSRLLNDEPVDGKYFFEVWVEVDGVPVEETRRAGYFGSAWYNYLDDPNNAGVTFFVDGNLNSVVTAQSIIDQEFHPLADDGSYLPIMAHVFSFWAAVPGNYHI